MKKMAIEIDEERIRELVENEVAENMVNNYSYEGREAQNGLRQAVDKAVQKYIYDKKDLIIDLVVDRAVKEMVRKGLPKLLEREE